MQLRLLMLFFLLVALPSCAVYRRNFDTPPEPGVEMASVTDLEQMIVETSQGPDLFFSGYFEDCASVGLNERKRVWVHGYYSSEGCFVPGHYMYLQ